MAEFESVDPVDGDSPSILTKAFDILRAFSADDRVMTLSELARAAGLPKSTVHRIIARLIDLGAIEQHRRGYKIGLGLFEMGVITPAGSMRDKAMPFLAALHRWTGLTVHLAVLRQFDVVYLEKFASANSPVTVSRVGARLPANCTAIGKAMLAWENFEDLEAFLPTPLPRLTPASVATIDELLVELRKIRAEKSAHESNESQAGVACMAVPVIVQDAAVAAVSVAYDSATRLDFKVEGALRQTTARIAAACRMGLANGHSHWFPRDY
ncbi:IclR family transcriptional regulator [Streptosporangium sp. NPDC049078]|uniref:IclR family transcriptional regulator n=1 Tax=Streptosporangium sp. NPDC049078 TaxID=3155767 RepID=UPI00341E247C